MKSIKNITLLAMLMVLGACSLSENEEAFFNAVKDKKVHLTDGDTLIGRFSSDGQTYTEISSSGELNIEFTEVFSPTKASYIIEKMKTGYTFETDGKTGTVFVTLLGSEGPKEDITLK